MGVWQHLITLPQGSLHRHIRLLRGDRPPTAIPAFPGAPDAGDQNGRCDTCHVTRLVGPSHHLPFQHSNEGVQSPAQFKERHAWCDQGSKVADSQQERPTASQETGIRDFKISPSDQRLQDQERQDEVGGHQEIPASSINEQQCCETHL